MTYRERNAQVVAARMSLTLRALGKKFGLSAERVRQILVTWHQGRKGSNLEVGAKK